MAGRGGGSPGPAVSFVPAAWRVAAGGALAAAAVWIAVLAGGTPEAAPRPPEDAIELAVRLWTAEGGGDGE